MGNNASIPNFANVTQFKVMIGDSAFVIPDNVQQTSPSGISSGLSPSTIFDSKRDCVGGYIFLAISDAAGPTALDDQVRVRPGDSIVLTVASSVATLQITSRNGIITTPFSFAYTSVGGVQGFYS